MRVKNMEPAATVHRLDSSTPVFAETNNGWKCHGKRQIFTA